MVTVNSMEEVEGLWINDNVLILNTPTWNEKLQAWTALANAYGMLAVVELKVTRNERRQAEG